MQNNKIYYSILFLFMIACADNSNPIIPEEETEDQSILDIVTWNIENYPKDNLTNTYLQEIIDSLNVDIIAIQEITSSNSLALLANSLDGWDDIVGPSHYGQSNAFLINSETITAYDSYEILTDISNEPFTKFPFILNFSFNQTNYTIINNHLKCCGDGNIDYNNSDDEEFRRLYSMQLIKDYVDYNLSSNNVIILGDLNDELVDNQNIFEIIFADSLNYLFTDYDIAQGSDEYWSYPGWPSHLDHILITNELFNAHLSTETLLIENFLVNGFSEYEQYISDHRPILLQLSVEP